MASPAPPPSSNILDVPSATSNESIAVDLNEILTQQNDDHRNEQLHEVQQLLVQERVNVRYWVRLAQECWANKLWRSAMDTAEIGLNAMFAAPPEGHDPVPKTDHIPLLLLKANFHLCLARKAPKTIPISNLTGPLAFTKDPQHPEFQRYGPQPGVVPMTKLEYWNRAEQDIGNAERIAPTDRRVRDIKAALFMARGRLDEASKLFERIIHDEPDNVMALMGRARIQFSARAFRPALKTYQAVLQLAPNLLPDPRIGIGLCFWMMGDRDKARRAWERSMVVHPTSPSPSAPLLLGLLHLNASKDPLLPGGDDARATAYERGLRLVQQAFKRDNTSAGAAAMGPIATHLGVTGASENALKLAERMLSFADTRLLVSEAHLARARALDGDPDKAQYHGAEVLASYQRALDANPESLIAALGVGSCFVRTEQFPHAINAYETLLRRQPKCVEALAALGALHAHLAFTFHSVSDSLVARKAAQSAYDQLLRVFSAGKGSGGGADWAVAKSERVRVLGRERDLYVEAARLWSDEQGVEKSLRAWEQAKRIEEEKAAEEEDAEGAAKEDGGDGEGKIKKDPVDPRVRNNVAVLLFNRRPQAQFLPDAIDEFQLALQAIAARRAAAGPGEEVELDAQLTAVSFNLGAAYEADGQAEKAREAWEQLLRVHPEYVEAKARLALLLIKTHSRTSWDAAHVLIKEALTSQPSSAELRALYTYFLVETGQPKLARDFARSTLKELSRHDVYALCASGLLSYQDARENKAQNKEAARDRAQKYTRAVEFFDKALQLQPQCAVAAQGLAIALAEGALGNGPSDAALSSSSAAGQQQQPVTEQQARLRNARDALGVLTKVKESVNEASVYVNIGHCHFARDEYERAVENYEMASKRYLHEKSSTVLWYLARAWYFKSLKEQKYADLQRAIEVGEKATALNPKDLANVFNMAVLKQKGFEILQGLPNERRTSADLQTAHEHLQASQVLFQQLVDDQTPHPPYPREIPKGRHSYGNSLLRRYEENLERQQAYEATEQGKLDAARRAREAEQAKRDEKERERLAQIQRQAEALAEQRRKMREEAETWAAMSKAWVDEDEDDEGRKRKGGAGGGKKRKTKMKEGGEESSSEEEGEKPVKKKRAPKKEKKEKPAKKGKSKAALAAAQEDDGEGDGARKMDVDEQYDEDDEDAPIRAKRRGRIGKNVKSAEFIESDDEEDE